MDKGKNKKKTWIQIDSSESPESSDNEPESPDTDENGPEPSPPE
jgi:hypothetical protein